MGSLHTHGNYLAPGALAVSGADGLGITFPDEVKPEPGLIGTLAFDRSLSIMMPPVTPFCVRKFCVPSAATESRISTPFPFIKLIALVLA